MKNPVARTFGCCQPGLRAVLGATLFAAALSACSGTDKTDAGIVLPTVDPDQSQFVALTNDVAADGTQPATLQVTVIGTDGVPMAGVDVVFKCDDAAVTIANPTDSTSSDGTTTGSVTSTTKGTYVIRAYTVGTNADASDQLLTPTVSVTFKEVVSPAVKLVFVKAPARTGLVANAAIAPPIKIAFKDANNNTVRSESRMVKLSLSFNPTQAVLSGTLEKAAVQGEVTFDDIVINKPGEGYELKAVVTPNAANVAAARSDPFQMTVGAASKFNVTSQQQSVDVGMAMRFTVAVADQYGNINTGYTGTVSFSTTDPKLGTPPIADYVFSTSDQGQKDFVITFRTAGEAQTITVADKANPTVYGTLNVHVYNGSPTKLTVTGIPVAPATVPAGDPMTFIVTLYDQFDNVVADPAYTGKVYFNVPTDSNAVRPDNYQFLALDKGTHSFTNELVIKTAIATPGHTFTAAAGGLQGVAATINNIMIVPKTEARLLTFTQQPPDPSETHKNFGFKASIQDEFGNTIPTKTNTITVSIGQQGEDDSGNTVVGNLTASSGGLSAAAVQGSVIFSYLQIDNNAKNFKLKISTTDNGNPIEQLSATFRMIDTTAPAVPVVTLTPTSNTLVMTWTAVGDDANYAGTAKSYAIKYCTEAACPGGANIATLGTAVATPPTPKAQGQAETFTLAGLNASTKYWVQLFVTDDATTAATTPSVAKSATTLACLAGYTGALCDTCATGYTSGPNNTCVNLCSTGTNPCTTPQADDCLGNTKRTYASPGACTATPATAPYYTCTYTATPTDCTATSQVCLGGACIANACAGQTCTPPAPSCDADGVTLITNTSACQVTSPTTFNCVPTATRTTCSGATPVCYTRAGTDAPACVATAVAPTAGSLIVTEMMLTPSGTNGKWFEIKNLTANAIDLGGVVVTETGANKTFTIPAGERISANSYYVFASAAVPGIGASVRAYTWPAAFTLAATGRITLTKSTTVGTTTTVTTIEDFTYGTAMAGTSGKSMQLSSVFQRSGTNSSAWYWCASTAVIGTTTDMGTPGADNGDCGMTRATDFTTAFTCSIFKPQVIPDPAATPVVPPAEVGVATKVYAHFSDTGITSLNAAGNDNYPFVKGELGFGPTATDPSAASWTWKTGAFNSAYTTTTSDDEMVADLIPTATGPVQYAWRFSLVDAAGAKVSNYVYCDRTAKVTATPPASANYGQATVRVGPPTVSAQISAVKNAADGASLNLLVDGAVVTYIRTFAGDFPGFFVQAEASGPALWLSIDPSTLALTPALAVGDKLSFTVTGKRTSSGVKEVYAISNVLRVSTGNSVAALTADFSSKTDTVATLNANEFRMVKTSGILVAAPNVPAGAGYVKAQFDTMGANGATNTLQVARFPTDLITTLGLGKNCRLTITAPLWRGTSGANSEAEFTAWNAADVTGVNCSPVVISQVYGAGGNTGATFTTDYVELHNRTDAAVTLTGWAIQYSASTATTAAWQVNTLPTVTLPAGGYYLVAMASGSNGAALSPAADYTVASSPINMSGTTGKVALTTSATALSRTPPTVTSTIADLVGYGTANYWEGTAPAPAQTATGASIRANSGCTDWDQNGTDFTTGTPAPRNAASPVFLCQ